MKRGTIIFRKYFRLEKELEEKVLTMINSMKLTKMIVAFVIGIWKLLYKK